MDRSRRLRFVEWQAVYQSPLHVASSLSDTFAGIAPKDVPLFVVAQLSGAAAAALLARLLFDDRPQTSKAARR